MSFKEFIKELGGNRVEGELIETFFYSIFSSALVLTILAFFIRDKNIFGNYGTFIVLSIITFGLLSLTLKQVRAYKEFNCMSGMMIGMTSGMIAGFLPGYYIGATNGMFIGSVFGMAVGIYFGIWNGKTCGIMGSMEGVMAGFMGGLMGAMTSVMLLNDHLKLATYIITLVAWVIMLMLNYMIYYEMKSFDRKVSEWHWSVIIFSAALSVLTILLMVFGPRSFLFGS